MYGLINNSLRDMIQKQFGEEKWQEVLAASGVPEDSFLSMRRYDDDITYSLAGAASEVLGAPVDACLEMFGQHWVLETASKSYGMLLDAAGPRHDRVPAQYEQPARSHHQYLPGLCAARISYRGRGYDLQNTLYKPTPGTERVCGWACLKAWERASAPR